MRYGMSVRVEGDPALVSPDFQMEKFKTATRSVPEATAPYTTGITQFLLAMALAAMGLETDMRKLAAAGIRPALLGAGAWVFISVFSLGLVLLLT